MPGFSTEEVEMRALFRQIDRNADGKLTQREIHAVLSDSGTEEGYIEALLCFTDVDENGYVDFEEFSVMYRKFKERLSRRVEKNNRVAMRKGGKEVSSLADLRRNGGATGRSERKKPQSGMSYDVKEVPETMKSWTSRKAAERALKKPKINKKEVLFWKSIFDEYDVDKNGSLTMQEMSEKMEEDPTFASIDVTTVFKSVDKDRSGAITFSELLRMLYPYTSKARLTEMLKFVAQQDIKPLSKKEDVLTDEQTQELKEIFELYDVDNSGTISLAEIRPILVNCGYEDEEVSKIWKERDKDRSGELEFDEFISLMKQAYFGTSFLDED
eukprot:CAMPEP_0113911706 /NCGR_PEP_ID=MMETSP0780_2-20120614/28400_1 /TAXON_ID=652834 /ORGANISM="Palpitomonas bilix" /LENGTH=326 /DNA_ID=CAMNT_0000908343 /DNA_START=327 /DNA_END=1307 /DNA_ORIENTATION=+ /assembly_acc=CAM_ASM_000599